MRREIDTLIDRFALADGFGFDSPKVDCMVRFHAGARSLSVVRQHDSFTHCYRQFKSGSEYMEEMANIDFKHCIRCNSGRIDSCTVPLEVIGWVHERYQGINHQTDWQAE